MGNYNFGDIFIENRLLDEVEGRKRQYNNVRANLTDDFAGAVGRIARTHPTLPGSAVIGGAQMGADERFYTETERRLAEQESNMWGRTWNNIFNAAKGGVRNAFLGFDFLWEETIPAWTRTLERSTRQGVGGSYNPVSQFTYLGNALNPFTEGGSEEFGRSTLSLAMRERREGQPVNVGSGFLPRSDPNQPGDLITQESHQLRNELQLAPGVSVSPGTFLARYITEPGSEPFNFISGAVDFSAQIALDPTNKIGGGYSKLRKANKGFGQTADLLPRTRDAAAKAGLISARRNSVFSPTAEKYITSRQGQELARNLAEDKNLVSIAQKLKIKDYRLARQISDTDNPDGISSILLDHLGSTIQEKPTATGLLSTLTGTHTPGQLLGGLAFAGSRGKIGGNLQTFGVMPTISYSMKQSKLGRLLADRPGRFIDLEDTDEALSELDDVLVNLNHDLDYRDKALRNFQTIFDADLPRDIKFENLQQGVRAIHQTALRKSGIEDKYINAILDKITINSRELKDVFVDNDGIPGYARPLMDGETAVDVMNGTELHILEDMVDSTMLLPDPRELRNGVTKMGKVMRIAGLVRPDLSPGAMIQTADWFNKWWRTTALLRGAWTARVVLEEQVRMAAAGYSSVASHPAEYLSMLWGKSLPTGRSLDTFLLDEWSTFDEFAAAHSRMGGGWANDPIRMAKSSKVWTKDEDGAIDAWYDQLTRLHRDDLARKVIEDPQNVREWYWSGAGKSIREKLIESGDQSLTTRNGADNHIDSVLARIHHMTGGSFEYTGDGYRITKHGNQDLLHMIRTGQLMGRDIKQKRRFTGELEQLFDSMPEKFAGPKTLEFDHQRGDTLINTLFEYLGSKPTNYLNRSPVFKQASYDNLARFIPHASQEVRDELRNNIIPGLNLTRSTKRKLIAALDTELPSSSTQKGFRIVGEDGEVYADLIQTRELADEWSESLRHGYRMDMTIQESSESLNQFDSVFDIQQASVAAALEDTKSLLYDVSRKSNLADTLRIISPFFEAWKEMVTVWPRLIRDNPAIIRKGQMLFEGARENGFFMPDENGEGEHFSIPGGNWLLGTLGSAISGVPLADEQTQPRLTGSVESLNMVTSSWVPGLGPLASIPVSALFDVFDEKQLVGMKGLEEVFLPFGRTNPSNISELAGSLAPTWVRRANEALSSNDPEIERMQANSQTSVMKHLLLSGKYDPSDQVTLIEESRKGAWWLGMIRAAATFFSPAPPKIEWLKRNDEDLITFTALTTARK